MIFLNYLWIFLTLKPEILVKNISNLIFHDYTKIPLSSKSKMCPKKFKYQFKFKKDKSI